MARGRKPARRGSLSIVGTGFIGAGHTTPEALSYIRSADKLFYLVGDPLTRDWLVGLNPSAETLYDCYGEGKSRRVSYAEMVERMLAPLARGKSVCVAFYGHPGVFVNPAHQAIRLAREGGHEAVMLPGISAEDCLFADLGVDPGELGCQSYEASDFLVRRRRFDPRSALVLWQVGAIGVTTFRSSDCWNPEGVRILAEVLGESYPRRHGCVVYQASFVPVCPPSIQRCTIATLPRASITVSSTLYVPPRARPPLDRAMLERLGVPRAVARRG